MVADVDPVRRVVFGVPDLTVVGAGPNESLLNLGGRDRKHDFAVELSEIIADNSARWGDMGRVLGGEIRADHRPGLGRIRGFEYHLATVVNGVVVERIDRQGRRPVAAILELVGRRVEGMLPRTDRVRLLESSIPPSDRITVARS